MIRHLIPINSTKVQIADICCICRRILYAMHNCHLDSSKLLTIMATQTIEFGANNHPDDPSMDRVRELKSQNRVLSLIPISTIYLAKLNAILELGSHIRLY